MSEFGEGYRIQTVMITANDVLQPHIMQQVLYYQSIFINKFNLSIYNPLQLAGHFEWPYQGAAWYSG